MKGPLRSESVGRGPEVVMVHGWGMSGRFMMPFAQRLANRFRVTLLDLPGHGQSPLIGDLYLSNLTSAALESAPAAAHWIGWSLGALVCLQAAAVMPDSVRSLTLLSGTPRFVAGPEWPGVDASVLRRFGDDLARDYRRTVDRFLALQLHGMDDERALLKALRACVAGPEVPAAAALNAGLRILEDTDLRVTFGALRLRILMILGGRDRLVPAHLRMAIGDLHRAAQVYVMPDAAHIPFWTHAEETERLVRTFLSGPHAD